MNVRHHLYVVRLTPEERDYLLNLVSTGKAAAKKLTHARILLKADRAIEGQGLLNKDIASFLDICTKTVDRVSRQFVEEGLDRALNHKRPGHSRPRILQGAEEAHLIALACRKAPEGRQRWTLKLLAAKMVELNIVESVSPATIGRVLKKTNSNRG